MAKKNCVICGKEGYSYFPFCYEHLQEKNAGKIVKCEDCGTWHYADKLCEKCEGGTLTNPTTETEKPIEEQEVQESKKCLLCENESGEYVFCKSCFSKYRNKTLLLKITVAKNQELELLDESYEGLYTCKDGHVVKSKSERDIDNYLFEHKIAHAYEKALVINSEVFHPDFYLPELDVYLEHWGYDENNLEYTRRKEYKIPKYKEKGITLISTYEKDMKDVDTSLDIKLSNYKKGEVNLE